MLVVIYDYCVSHSDFVTVELHPDTAELHTRERDHVMWWVA